jgi:hypothetical protein
MVVGIARAETEGAEVAEAGEVPPPVVVAGPWQKKKVSKMNDMEDSWRSDSKKRLSKLTMYSRCVRSKPQITTSLTKCVL